MSSNELVVARMEECWQVVRRETEGLDLAAPVYPDPLWTVRDVLLHCAFWNDEATKAVEACRNGDSYMTDTGADSFAAGLDAMNQRVVEASRPVPDDEVRPRWIAAQERFTAAVRAMDDAAMDREIVAPWHERKTVVRMIDDELAHEQDHITDALTAVSANEER